MTAEELRALSEAMTAADHGEGFSSTCIYCEAAAALKQAAAVHPEVLAQRVRAEWEQTCAGNYNPDVCESCRAFKAAIEQILHGS